VARAEAAPALPTAEAPLPQIDLIPTGGVTPETIGAFLKAGAMAAAAGSALVDNKMLKEKNWAAITARARAFADAVAAAK
jgi:2-dehydro-3-deoxyphosphogluconate aldolase/(4S)-4-hydroxy-2-oxoglutarate aldolase